MASLGRLRRALDLLIDPVTREKRQLLRQRWSALPEPARTATQGFGRQGLGCGATIGVQPFCDFSCTGCYLGVDANTVPPAPLENVYAQLRQLRAYLGPKSNVQITDGEVTLRDTPELCSIIAFAKSLGMIPMIMTHGDAFRRDPRLLPRLVEAGLTEVSFHVDATQRGRDGFRTATSEIDLMPLRDEIARMVRAVRRETGTRLRAAMTMTVTRDNVRHVSDVTRWVILNHDAISLISYQPAARVGRTRSGVEGVGAAELWHEIAKATTEFGAPIGGPRPLDFGHPDCSHYTPFVAVTRRGDSSPALIQAIRDTPDDIALLEEYLSLRSIGMTFRDDSIPEALARAAGAIRLEPGWFLSRARRWVDARLQESLGTTLLPLVLSAILGRTALRSVTIASHHFMSADEIATPVGTERLAACVFRVPVGGRMVSMCEVNALGARDRVYDEMSSGSTKSAAGG